MTPKLDAAVVDSLAAELSGEVVRPQDAAYDEVRSVFNAMIDSRPAAIVRCADSEDIAAGVRLARDQGLVVAVRSGGHSVAGTSVCDEGVVLDLSPMKSIEIDPAAGTARVGAGVLWGELDAATQERGLHTPGGRVTTTGVGGFTTGGGYGWTSSKHGLTADNLVSAEVVTADGERRTASEDENPDLFWAIKGGGCNFGVVAEFEFRLHELGPTVFGGLAMWRIDRAPEAMRGWRDFADAAPDEVSTGCAVLTAPPEEFVPEHLRGTPVFGVLGMYVGDPDRGAEAFQPVRDLQPELDLFQPMPYTQFQAMVDPGNQPGFRNYWRGEYLEGLGDEAIDTFLEHAREPLSPFNQLIVFRLGQGVSMVPDEDSAFSHRDAQYLFHPIAMWEDPADDERLIAFVRGFSEAMRPFATGGMYLNFTPDRDRARAAFGEDKYRRLVEVKDRYDPENLFRHNQNIRPSGRTGATVG